MGRVLSCESRNREIGSRGNRGDRGRYPIMVRPSSVGRSALPAACGPSWPRGWFATTIRAPSGVPFRAGRFGSRIDPGRGVICGVEVLGTSGGALRTETQYREGPSSGRGTRNQKWNPVSTSEASMSNDGRNLRNLTLSAFRHGSNRPCIFRSVAGDRGRLRYSLPSERPHNRRSRVSPTLISLLYEADRFGLQGRGSVYLAKRWAASRSSTMPRMRCCLWRGSWLTSSKMRRALPTGLAALALSGVFMVEQVIHRDIQRVRQFGDVFRL